MIRRYYEDELNYLYEAGKEFARTHPEQARYLQIGADSTADRDPYVERLFEGFAFLTGKIRERLDDEIPELTDALFNLLWPHYLRPVPALAIVEFRPKQGMVQETTILKRGSEVRSGPVGDEHVPCRFRTTQDVRLQPLRLDDAALAWLPDGTTSVTLKFQLAKGAEYKKLQLSPLRVHIHAEPAVASIMHMFFTRHVSRVAFWSASDRSDMTELEGQEWVRPAGFAEEEGILPYSPHSFPGFRLLHEYLSFRQKFWTFDLLGFERFSPPEKTAEFFVRVEFQRGYPEEKRFKTENLRLFCSPVVNLYKADAEPVRIDHLKHQYRVLADARAMASTEIYSIESVVGVEEGTGTRHVYTPFAAFRHGPGRYYSASMEPNPAERYDTYLSIGGFDVNESTLVPETLSLEIVATNGSLPREKLAEKSINQPGPEFPNIVTFENLSQPTLDLHPPGREGIRNTRARERFFWKLMSHLSLNFRSIASAEALRALLELYDWTGTDANRLRIAGIRDVRWKPRETLLHGAVLRGTEVTIEVQDGSFADEGDVCLFGAVLVEFLTMYATVNSFVHLTIVTRPSEKEYRWQPSVGLLSPV